MINKIILKFLEWLDGTKLWEDFFETLNLYNVRFKGYPAFEMSDYFKIVDRSSYKNHYVFLSTDSKSLSSIVIKGAVKSARKEEGFFSHAGLVFFKGDRHTSILHVRDVGFVEQPLIDFLKTVDYFCVIKLPTKPESDDNIQQRIDDLRKRAKQITYDWEQSLENDMNKLYCSELIYNLLKDYVTDPDFKPRKILGRYVFDPDLLLNCGEIIYNNHPKVSSYISAN